MKQVGRATVVMLDIDLVIGVPLVEQSDLVLHSGEGLALEGAFKPLMSNDFRVGIRNFIQSLDVCL